MINWTVSNVIVFWQLERLKSTKKPSSKPKPGKTKPDKSNVSNYKPRLASAKEEEPAGNDETKEDDGLSGDQFDIKFEMMLVCLYLYSRMYMPFVEFTPSLRSVETVCKHYWNYLPDGTSVKGKFVIIKYAFPTCVSYQAILRFISVVNSSFLLR